MLAQLTEDELEDFLHEWRSWARPSQWPPDVAADGAPWTTWLMMGGRGSGKTRAGAEWVRALALGRPPAAAAPLSPIALVGETSADVREVMVEGVSGLMRIHPRGERPQWLPSRRRLEWPNGAVAQAFSADDPEQLRGPQFAAAWCDEIAKWSRAEQAFDMLQFALRLGEAPRQVVTTTPRAVPMVRRLLADPRVAVTRMTTAENALNLAPRFLDTVVARYRGTRLGRQELLGELIEDRPGTLFPRDVIERGRVAAAPPLPRVVVAVDPPASAHRASDACGIVAAGRAEDGRLYVLADRTARGLRPAQWAARALALYRQLEADALVAEANQGGEMVRAVLAEADPAVPVRLVHARRGKWLRAEPVAQLYEQGKVAHVGAFPELEDEMADFAHDGLSDGRSPDRLDALVWALATLTEPATRPRVRRM
ncbi:Terminase-like family protein [Blastochloris viridis]|uniref:Gene transfer agent terminase protein n=1 Tax=Blastochloris viridis TaxID=1079 RepID=A0A182D354_BLAVI|nr:Terminase-like family protein [Blastochloris viridis]BAR99936.1 gene transfer agent terminase protein [Blastochloris viridis]